ncbi:tetratricopeptide repeat protein, partial [Frankia sp. AgB1.9]|uniref:tetratricopeptide repeat protein n=2 Tax=unclassified Frankia TaxID=2632575 RepID=UPI0019330014
MPDGQINIAARDLYRADAQHFYNREPSYELAPFPLMAPLPSTAAAPSRLLSARYRLVPFAGREAERARLAGWRDGGADLAARLVQGPGGQGKSRLAAQFAVESAAAGWAVWTAREMPALAGGREPLPGGDGLLVVVDYAERWPLTELMGLLADRRVYLGVPVRVLLLARSGAGWWESIVHRLDDQDVAVSDQMLGPVADSLPSREETFAAAARGFGELLGVEGTGVRPPAGLGDDAFRLVLTVHMAALVAVDALRTGASVPEDPAMLSGYLLRRERDHWRQLHDTGARPMVTVPEVLGRAVFTATVTRPLPYEAAATVLERVGLASAPEVAGQILSDHAVCYPPSDPSLVLEPLYPDRLGEDFLALLLPGAPGRQDGDPWTDSAMRRLLVPGDSDEVPVWADRAWTVLVETAKRWPHVGERLHGILHCSPDLVMAAGGAALTALASWDDVGLNVLVSVERLFPDHRHVDLDAAMAAVTARLHTYRLSQTNDPAEHARLWERLARRLHYAGRREEALAATEQAMEIRRRLAAANPVAFEPDLADSLDNLGLDLSGVGRWEEALGATEQAVEIRRRLAAANPVAFEPDLATALSNLGIWLSGVGRREEALAATEQAMEIRRRLAAANPVAFEPDLATALSNLGIWLSGVGRREEALAATEQA